MGNILPERRDLKDTPQTPKVIEPSVLTTVGERMVNTAIVNDVDEESRTRDMMCQWNLDGLLNIVSEDGFFNMVSAALGGMRKTLLNQQPNGDWQPHSHEFEIRPGRQEKPELFMGIRWVDANNAEDIVYGTNGQPVVNVNVMNNKNSGDNDLKEILQLLAKKQVSNDTLIEALQSANDAANEAKAAATEEPAPAPKTRKVKR